MTKIALGKIALGYDEAIQMIRQRIRPLPAGPKPLPDCIGHVAAEDVCAGVNAPSADTSLKDGYALEGAAIRNAGPEHPVRLTCSGNAAAGQDVVGAVRPGTAVRILTGARLPRGADTVVAEEFATVSGDRITITIPTETGKNILAEGSDTRAGETLVRKGDILTPGIVGRLASGGCGDVPVHGKPGVAILATGDEILLPGQTLTRGKLYASNMFTLNGWCRAYGMETTLDVCRDNREDLEACLQRAAASHDAVITSGGAWSGDKDLTAKCLAALGWEKCFHRLCLGPGKAAGFGLLDGTPLFILPGGPPSNLVAFLTLALPGLLALCGFRNPGLPRIRARLTRSVNSQAGWTHALFGRLEDGDDGMAFTPMDKTGSRLKSMAEATALLLVPEGVTRASAGETVTVLDMAVSALRS